MESYKCPRCKVSNTEIVDYKSGEVVCSKCGFVFDEELIDEHNEQRIFSKTCSSNGYSNKDISRTSLPITSYKFGEDNEIKLIGKKTKNIFYKKTYKYKNNKELPEKEKKILKKENDLNKIDYELKKICTYFNINKMIYQASKEEIIKLYDYGKISIRSNNWKLILGLIINYTLKNKTENCFSKEEIINYFKCDINTLKKESIKIYPFLTNNATILEKKEENQNIININNENKLDKYFNQLQKDIYILINKTKIKTITGISDSYDIISIYINNNIFNIETIPTICLAGGSLIFCVKLYNIQFSVINKNKNILDESYSMINNEEEEKLINYIAKKCGTGINKDKLKAVYNRMIKYKNILSDNNKYKNYLDNIYTENDKDNIDNYY